MATYTCESERIRMTRMGWSLDQIEDALAVMFRYPTVKRLRGLESDSPEVREVDSVLGELVGIILGDGYRLSDSTGVFADGHLISFKMYFVGEGSRIYFEAATYVTEGDSDVRDSIDFKVSMSRCDDITREISTSVRYPSRLDAIDRYDTIVDIIVPGIDRMKRFAMGFCDV